MKKRLLIGIIVVFILLDFAALDDITTGNEPDFVGEYATLFLSILVFVGIGFYLFRSKNKNN